MPKITRRYKYVEDREEYFDVPAYLIDRFVAESEDYDVANFDDPDFIQALWWFLEEEGEEPLTHDFDSWYGNPIGDEINISYGVENA